MSLVHHMRRKARLLEQLHQLCRAFGAQSMVVDGAGRPYIATYFRREGTDVPQYQLIYHDGATWQTREVGGLTTPFRLGGGGTKRDEARRMT